MFLFEDMFCSKCHKCNGKTLVFEVKCCQNDTVSFRRTGVINTDFTNNIAQFRQSLIVLFVCSDSRNFEILNTLRH